MVKLKPLIVARNASQSVGSGFNQIDRRIHRSPYPLQASLGGVSVKGDVRRKTVNAIPVVVSPGQNNATLPGNTPVGTASFTVSYNGTSAAFSFQVVASSFGAFSVNSAGNGPGVITDANYQIYGASTSANAGDVSILWATGLGASAGDDRSAQPTSPRGIKAGIRLWGP